MLEVRRLFKSFGEKLVVKDVSFKLAKGEIAVLIGPNAAGKTTILKSIAGLLEPDSGTIVIDGEIVYEKAPGARRARVNKPPNERNVGYLPAEPSLFPHLTIRENLELPLRKRGWSRSDIEKRVNEVLEASGLKGYEDHYPGELSSGLMQKASIARVLTYSPSIILLDEPFSSIDQASRERLRHEFLRLFRESNATILLTTHLLEDILFFKEHVIALINGRLAYNGGLSEEEVVSSPYMLELLGFLRIPVKTKKCIGYDEALVDIGGKESMVKYNPYTSACVENHDEYLVINPGFIEVSVDEGSGDGNVLEVFLRGYVDELASVKLIIEINGNSSVFRLDKSSWLKLGGRVGDRLFLRVDREHLHLVDLWGG